jgi:hypothetical protein
VPISEAQLTTWANIGAEQISASSYASVRYALGAGTSPIRTADLDIYLQGSYRNHTNIRGDSDVDIVVRLNSASFRDITALPSHQLANYNSVFSAAQYTWPELQRDTITALRGYFGNNSVTVGTKAIKVITGTGRMTADVVPAFQFRRYTSYFGPSNETYIKGIQFFDSSGNAIINYPKLHIEYGEWKNATLRTNGNYKPIVRIFKNIKRQLIEQNRI